MVSVRYKGIKIKVISVEFNFDFVSFYYPNNIIIYVNKNINKQQINNIMHDSIRKARS